MVDYITTHSDADGFRSETGIVFAPIAFALTFASPQSPLLIPGVTLSHVVSYWHSYCLSANLDSAPSTT